MDFGTFIDGLVMLHPNEINRSDSPIDIIESQFFTSRVKSVNSFTNFVDYSLISRTRKISDYFSKVIEIDSTVPEDEKIFAILQCFVVHSLRGEYFIKFHAQNEHDYLAHQKNSSLSKFIFVDLPNSKFLDKNKVSSKTKIYDLITRNTKAQNTQQYPSIFQGIFSEFEKKFDKLIIAKRIGGISIVLDETNIDDFIRLLDLVKSKKSYFCNLIIMIESDKSEYLLGLLPYYSNFVKTIHLSNKLILNTQLA